MSNVPINIVDLVPGAVVRIQLVGPFIFMPVQPGAAQVVSNQSPLPYRRSLVVGNVRRNDFQNRQLTIEYQDTTFIAEYFLVDVPYKRIRVIEKQLESQGNNHNRLRIPAYVPILGIF